MGIGSVNIVKVDNMQGDFSTPERLFLYVGKIADIDLANEVIPISAESNLDQVLGVGDSELKTQISAARTNSRSTTFACYAIGINENDDWKEVVFAALDKPFDLNVEAIVFCTPLTDKVGVELCSTVANEILVRFAKFVTVIGCVSSINNDETWSEYIVRINAIVENVAAERVCIVPLLHGNDLGCVCGRLCDKAVSIADSPMRVATGAIIGLGESPVDANGAPLVMATIATMAEHRFCVPQWYSGYDGVYWADMATLAAEGSDYSVLENLRVIDYCARRVRILAISRIADRRLNSTPASIAFNKTYFMKPLREASRPIVMNGIEQPSMIMPPEDGDITITWANRTDVSIAIAAAPYNCPKKITVYLGLDLSNN